MHKKVLTKINAEVVSLIIFYDHRDTVMYKVLVSVIYIAS